MRGRGLVQADCPTCGEVIAQASALVCGVSEAEETAICEFSCPGCERPLLLRLAPAEVPTLVGDRMYLDGGLVDHVPLAPAIAMGADTIYVLSCGFPCPPNRNHRSARLVLAHSIGILLSQRIRIDTQQAPTDHPNLRIVSLPPVCSRAGLRDFTRVGSFIDKAREQSRLFLSGQPCHTCDHDRSRLGAAAANEEVVRLQADLSVA
jgi:hypothetical protein